MAHSTHVYEIRVVNSDNAIHLSSSRRFREFVALAAGLSTRGRPVPAGCRRRGASPPRARRLRPRPRRVAAERAARGRGSRNLRRVRRAGGASPAGRGPTHLPDHGGILRSGDHRGRHDVRAERDRSSTTSRRRARTPSCRTATSCRILRCARCSRRAAPSLRTRATSWRACAARSGPRRRRRCASNRTRGGAAGRGGDCPARRGGGSGARRGAGGASHTARGGSSRRTRRSTPRRRSAVLFAHLAARLRSAIRAELAPPRPVGRTRCAQSDIHVGLAVSKLRRTWKNMDALHAKIAALEAKNTKLEAENAAKDRRIAELEKRHSRRRPRSFTAFDANRRRLSHQGRGGGHAHVVVAAVAAVRRRRRPSGTSGSSATTLTLPASSATRRLPPASPRRRRKPAYIRRRCERLGLPVPRAPAAPPPPPGVEGGVRGRYALRHPPGAARRRSAKAPSRRSC